MPHRCFLAMPLAGAIERVELDGAESRHLVHVLRSRIGDHVLVFDGSGREAIGAVERVRAGLAILEETLRHFDESGGP